MLFSESGGYRAREDDRCSYGFVRLLFRNESGGIINGHVPLPPHPIHEFEGRTEFVSKRELSKLDRRHVLSFPHGPVSHRKHQRSDRLEHCVVRDGEGAGQSYCPR